MILAGALLAGCAGLPHAPPAIRLADTVTMTPRVTDCDLPPGLLDKMLPVPVNVQTVCGMIGVKLELP